ncbi:hypothetical protein GDO81_015423 [Engystomops pustulosus]|uniref:Uncharacterized protein n=1 Tax=Engystomops pustulosus TaxID=76066 RepID=A0AAV7ANP3_ENGPU|nr:hypothetical protein GDO81_015423 [Engystomops pustulosus]
MHNGCIFTAEVNPAAITLHVQLPLQYVDAVWWPVPALYEVLVQGMGDRFMRLEAAPLQCRAPLNKQEHGTEGWQRGGSGALGEVSEGLLFWFRSPPPGLTDYSSALTKQTQIEDLLIIAVLLQSKHRLR